jgi:hypothetical protein
MSPYCIGVFEKAVPTRIRVVPLSATASFSTPAYIDSTGEWQVLDASGSLYRIDDALLSLHKLATASSFFPPYYYHATPVPTRALPARILWCALGSERTGQVQGCFNASTMESEGVSPAGSEGFRTNIADCGFSAAAGRLVCAGYNGSQYGVVGFDTSQPSMASALLGADQRTSGWKYGFGVQQFVVLGGDMFVMLAQPNLGDQRHAEIFVTRWDRATEELSTVATAVQPALDKSIAWAAF